MHGETVKFEVYTLDFTVQNFSVCPKFFFLHGRYNIRGEKSHGSGGVLLNICHSRDMNSTLIFSTRVICSAKIIFEQIFLHVFHFYLFSIIIPALHTRSLNHHTRYAILATYDLVHMNPTVSLKLLLVFLKRNSLRVLAQISTLTPAKSVQR